MLEGSRCLERTNKDRCPLTKLVCALHLAGTSSTVTRRWLPADVYGTNGCAVTHMTCPVLPGLAPEIVFGLTALIVPGRREGIRFN